MDIFIKRPMPSKVKLTVPIQALIVRKNIREIAIFVAIIVTRKDTHTVCTLQSNKTVILNAPKSIYKVFYVKPYKDSRRIQKNRLESSYEVLRDILR
jgi:hypothetical protein